MSRPWSASTYAYRLMELRAAENLVSGWDTRFFFWRMGDPATTPTKSVFSLWVCFSNRMNFVANNLQTNHVGWRRDDFRVDKKTADDRLQRLKLLQKRRRPVRQSRLNGEKNLIIYHGRWLNIILRQIRRSRAPAGAIIDLLRLRTSTVDSQKGRSMKTGRWTTCSLRYTRNWKQQHGCVSDWVAVPALQHGEIRTSPPTSSDKKRDEERSWHPFRYCYINFDESYQAPTLQHLLIRLRHKFKLGVKKLIISKLEVLSHSG